MPTHTVLLHQDGPALWSARKTLAEIHMLQRTTTELVFSGTYQGQPTPPQGSTFERSWFSTYPSHEPPRIQNIAGRWISWDTAYRDHHKAAYSAWIIGDLMTDYTLRIRHTDRQRLKFPELVSTIVSVAQDWDYDKKLRGIIIEDKASGISAFQTLKTQAPSWMRDLLATFMPTVSKEDRASQASVWCKNKSVLLPQPESDLFWLYDFEDQLFTFPQSEYKDMVDAFSQLVLYLERLLEAGQQARIGR